MKCFPFVWICLKFGSFLISLSDDVKDFFRDVGSLADELTIVFIVMGVSATEVVLKNVEALLLKFLKMKAGILLKSTVVL